MKHISQLTNLAFQFGPFLFALLFTLYISRWGYKNYNQANLRCDPPASEKEINTYRLYFLGTAIFGFILVIISIIWWFNIQVSYHVFAGKIVNLREYEEITSNDLYFKSILVTKLEENLPQIRDEHFLFIQNEPFDNNQKFKIYYSKGQGKVEEFSINYSSQILVEYCVDWDENSGNNILRCLTSPQSSLFFKSAYAQEFKVKSDYESFSSTEDRIDKYLVQLLQEERTDIGQKIEALDKLSSLEDSQLKYYIEKSIYKEPMTLTLLDLSRHTDKELAYKAKKIINDRFKIDDYLVHLLLSDSKNREEAIEILFRIEKDRALQILNNIPIKMRNSWFNDLKKEIEFGEKAKILIPTGSSKGDRYYVQAKWDPKNSKVVECLTELFFRELIHNRTYEEEIKLMKGENGQRSERWVYWYSKEWALYIAQKIENCGGKAYFVGIRY
ncbi:MAG: hypothetical protein JW866_04180 [Ignavibacteriales bacterium]|nr:hypothetical protein [Ignavibacteriales bacterium]